MTVQEMFVNLNWERCARKQKVSNLRCLLGGTEKRHEKPGRMAGFLTGS
jgi:hypothetical protein